MSISVFNWHDTTHDFNSIFEVLKKDGICIFKNYFDKQFVESLYSESVRVLHEYAVDVQILDKEDCSNDERLFHAQKYSDTIKLFADDSLLNKLAARYNKNIDKKTLVNRIVHEPGVIKNSGAGWHRDNHSCQFKSLMYLTDVSTQNGNFQWVTNSNANHIGMPEPRTASYTTRFHDNVVESIVQENAACEIIDVTGDAGDIVVTDTTYIHRGNIIQTGERVALTQYYFT